MSKRRVYIEGIPRDVFKIIQPDPSLDMIDYNYLVNLQRKPGTPIRHGNDYWPVGGMQYTASYDGQDDRSRPVMELIVTSLKPMGCASIWYIRPEYAEFEPDAPDRVWALQVRMTGGGLRTVFMRAALRDVGIMPFAMSHIASQNIRPLNKIRFDDYFVPERNFCYIGYPYR